MWRLRRKLIAFTYLVTRDLVQTLERKIGYALGKNEKGNVWRLEEEFLTRFQRYLPQAVSFTAMEGGAMSDALNNAVMASPYPVVSLDRVYVPAAAAFLEATRRTDPITARMYIAERPGTAPLNEQLNALSNYRAVALADVGAFEGTTLTAICTALEERGVEVKQVILGVTSTEAAKRLNNIRPVQAMNSFNFYDWVELRDLFGIDGRAVPGDTRRFLPYWENLEEWASIPAENEPIVRQLCIEYSTKLRSALAGQDLRKIGIAESFAGERT